MTATLSCWFEARTSASATAARLMADAIRIAASVERDCCSASASCSVRRGLADQQTRHP
ncbi:hypothetical protein IW249_006184 [Micromonospora vinacea]|uniref:Uncharacterized protein n=1 Tax=Micromonospora vinacea TaxID=709878 RepID=A0ABS0KAV5_9ACTN|nr:hypothetical protein [Micromonospora vinacea]MBG6105770.1 hypothetical protein [Micromonospora vinacea]WTA65497.1 hypothetical protein OHB51_23635 [Micromonospora sp. NBC_00855]